MEKILACPSCDLLQRLSRLEHGQHAHCPRCGDLLEIGERLNFQRNLALSVAVLILLFSANYFPIMTLELDGQRVATTVLECVRALWLGDRIETAVLVLAVTIIIPLARALAVVYVTVPMILGRPAWRRAGLLRFISHATPWGMTEVYLLGALVRVRKSEEQTSDCVYVVDQTQRLVGVVYLRELLLAQGRKLLSEIMSSDPQRVLASTSSAALLAHPGWQEVPELPVVDDHDAYLGVVHYRMLRALERELRTPLNRDSDTGAAFGQVIAAAAGGVIEAIGGGGQKLPGEQ